MRRQWRVVSTMKRGTLPTPEIVDAVTQIRLDISVEAERIASTIRKPVKRDVFWGVKSA